jgi:hypothetical protein
MLLLLVFFVAGNVFRASHADFRRSFDAQPDAVAVYSEYPNRHVPVDDETLIRLPRKDQHPEPPCLRASSKNARCRTRPRSSAPLRTLVAIHFGLAIRVHRWRRRGRAAIHANAINPISASLREHQSNRTTGQSGQKCGPQSPAGHYTLPQLLSADIKLYVNARQQEIAERGQDFCKVSRNHGKYGRFSLKIF